MKLEHATIQARSVAIPSNGTELGRYHYNPLGQRDSKVVNGQTQHFVYDQQGRLIHESRSDGTGQRDYVYLDGRLIANLGTTTKADKPISYVHTDHLGTPQVITDPRGWSIWSATYTPFGEAQITNSITENNIRFPGQYFDAETGLHYNYHRYYDPQTGRYIESDPIGLRGGLNTYTYANNNPISYTDPYGLWSMGDPLPQEVVDASAGFGDALSFGITYEIRELMGTNESVNTCSGSYRGGVGAGVAVQVIGFRTGGELRIGSNWRIAPWGNRTGNPYGELPHYHRRGQLGPDGLPLPGQGKSRHRPWEGW